MLVYIVFGLLIITMSTLNPKKGFKKLALESIIILSTFIVFLTEILSLFKLLNLISIVVTWAVVTLFLIFILIKNKTKSISTLKKIKLTFSNYYSSCSFFEKTLSSLVIIGLSLMLFQGIMYPPNNWDSLTYHMSRIMYWLGNESINHYPTHILRQLYQPPFSEFFIMHVNVLNGNDYLANSVELFFVILSIVTITLILGVFKLERFYKLLSALLLITIPSLEMQASTTKNDIVCGFFILATTYYCITSFYHSKLKNFIFLGLSIGLGILTKGTSYLFLTPILLFYVLLTLFKIIKYKEFKIIYHGIIVLFLFSILNLGHYTRNYQINNSIINIDEVESKYYANEDLNINYFFSNLLKNIGLHIDNPFKDKYDIWIRNFHKNQKLLIDNPKTNFLALPYAGIIQDKYKEDNIPNSLHLYLCFFSLLIFLFLTIKTKKIYHKELIIVVILLLQISLFIGYLKWQPWHTRLHIPIFMFSVLFVVFVSKLIKNRVVVFWFLLPLLTYSFYDVCFNNVLRPINYDSNKISLKDSRFHRYFSCQPNLYEDYSNVLNLIYTINPKKVGLIMTDWEYPLFHSFYYTKIKLNAININNITKKIDQNTDYIEAIISNNENQKYLIFNGKIYLNKTPNNKYLWMYY